MIWVKRIFAVISAIAVIIGLIFGVNIYEAKFATAEDIVKVREDVELLGERLENKILEDRIHALQERIWRLEDRYGGATVPHAPPTILEHYRELHHHLELIKAKIKR
jgi:hypothetical protein